MHITNSDGSSLARSNSQGRYALNVALMVRAHRRIDDVPTVPGITDPNMHRMRLASVPYWYLGGCPVYDPTSKSRWQYSTSCFQ